VTPLTASQATITTAIDNQIAQGATNITAGLTWGWRVLSPGEPFAEGRAYADGENQKILILMTDGANTYYPNSSLIKSWYGAWGYVQQGHLGSTSTTATAMTSLTTGLSPGEHGVVGYRVHVHHEILNVLRWSTPDGDARRSIPPSEFQPLPEEDPRVQDLLFNAAARFTGPDAPRALTVLDEARVQWNSD